MAKSILPQNAADDNDDSSLPDASELWSRWGDAILLLRPAFAYTSTFFWFATVVAGLTIGTDAFGVMSIVRALKLHRRCYDSLLKHFHSDGVRVDTITMLWGRVIAPRLFGNRQVYVGGRRVLVADGIKKAKRGRKMPGVKCVHQESDMKPEYTMAHSLQAVSMLVQSEERIVAVPLAIRIHEGVVWCNAIKETLLTKMLALAALVAGDDPYILVADRYYASGTIIKGLVKNGNHLVTRMKSGAVAYALPPAQEAPRKRGRPKVYGKYLELASLFTKPSKMLRMVSPVYGEDGVSLRYAVHDLLWKPAGQMVRFVAVIHPTRGRCIFMSTDTTLDAIEIIRLYGLRFKIEYAFKHAVHTIRAFCYRFWMANMTPLERMSGNQYLHRKTPEYRRAVVRKLHAYHVFLQAGVIAQSLVQYLAASCPERVWKAFGPWLRTIRPGVPPSEFVTATALRQSLPDFLEDSADSHIFAKFIAERQHKENPAKLGMAA